MKSNLIEKLENQERIIALDIKNTLQKIHLEEGTVFYDFGAGTGLFTFLCVSALLLSLLIF